MENLLGGLAKVTRLDGKHYYCFSEVKIKLFSEIPSGTLKTWIRSLEISKEKCSLTEHNFFKSKLPDIAVGAFKLISEQHLLKLLSHSMSRKEFQRQQVFSSNSISDCIMTPSHTCTLSQPPTKSSLVNFKQSERNTVEPLQNCGFKYFQPPFEFSIAKNDAIFGEHLPHLNDFSSSHVGPSLSTVPIQSPVNTSQTNFAAEGPKLRLSSSPLTGNETATNYLPYDRNVAQNWPSISNCRDNSPLSSSGGGRFTTAPSQGATCPSVNVSDVFKISKLAQPFSRSKVLPSEQAPSFSFANEFSGDRNSATASCSEEISESTELSCRPHCKLATSDDESRSFETGAVKENASAAATLYVDSDSGSDSGRTKKKNMFKFRKGDSITLPVSELSESAAEEIADFRLFYTKLLNSQRRGSKLEESTLNKALERMLAFYKFLKHSKQLEPGLKYFEDENLLEEFVSHLLDPEQRGLKSVTVSRYMSSFLYAVKFLNRGKSHKTQDDLPSVSHLKALRSQLERSARTERHLSPRSNRSRPILFEEILQVAREVLFQFEEASGIQKARALMELCLLLLYTSASPGRSKEFVTLQIARESAEVAELGGNVLLMETEKITLITNDYKTKNTYGTDRTELDEDHLVYYVRLYVNRFRSMLLQGNQHKYFFVNYHGQPFSVPALSTYIGNFFEKHCNVRLGIRDLRHSLVTYFLSLPESNNNHELGESMACLMRHSVRSQRRHYDSRSRDERKQSALNFLKRKSIGAVFGESDNEDSGSSRSDTDEEGFITANPCAGDFVALVANNSTSRQPEVFIGKVLRFSHDKNDVLLAHLEELQENHFKVVVGKSYWERKNSLVYPIDLAYLPSDGIYQLRSSKLELHQNVFSK